VRCLHLAITGWLGANTFLAFCFASWPCLAPVIQQPPVLTTQGSKQGSKPAKGKESEPLTAKREGAEPPVTKGEVDKKIRETTAELAALQEADRELAATQRQLMRMGKEDPAARLLEERERDLEAQVKALRGEVKVVRSKANTSASTPVKTPPHPLGLRQRVAAGGPAVRGAQEGRRPGDSMKRSSETPARRLEGYRYCLECRHAKEPRTRHCSSCGCCIARMDHHCIFLGRCVGLHNHRQFLVFLLYLEVSVLYALGTLAWLYLAVVPHYVHSLWSWVLGRTAYSSVEGRQALCLIAIAAEAAICLITAILVGILTWQVVDRALRGTVYVESQFSPRAAEELPPRSVTNLRLIFGNAPAYRWLLPSFEPGINAELVRRFTKT